MKTFHHGGRIGDLIFALWTMKHMGGGRLIVSDYHKGNWDLDVAESMRSFLEMQTYIEGVRIVPYSGRDAYCSVLKTPTTQSASPSTVSDPAGRET